MTSVRPPAMNDRPFEKAESFTCTCAAADLFAKDVVNAYD